MKKLILILTALCLLISVTACGPTDPNVGKYVCVAVESDDKNAAPDDEWIVLESNGKGSINVGLELDMKWRMDNGELIIDTEFIANTYKGTLRNGEITLTIEDVEYTFVKEEMQEQWAETLETGIIVEETDPIPVDEEAVGHYSCISVTIDGKSSSPENQWIDLFDDGTAVAYFGLKYPGKWYVLNGQLTITLNNEETFTGSVLDGEMTLLGDTTYLLKKTGEPGSGSESSSAEQSTVLYVGSKWSGTLKVKNHDGEGVLEDGEYDIVAVIGESDGGTYFEVYYKNNQEDTPIVSFWVNMRNNFIEPIIDEDAENAWIFEETLEEDEAFDLTMFLDSENQLDFYYEYDTRAEEADLYFSFYPDHVNP